jgi:Cell division protein FtsI/penicillin-binding protein 2
MIVIAICIFVFAKAFYIQQVQGKYWRSMSDSLHQKIEEVSGERGTIYSEDGEMLSTGVPQFDIYIDFGADGLHDKNGKLFKQNVDSLSYALAELFKDKPAYEYKRILKDGFDDEDRYFLLKRNISYREYQQLQNFPLVRLGRNKSGFIAESKSIRLNPYKLLAFRTIGLDRDSFKVGLEMTYDSVLKGKSGSRLVRYIAGGVSVPVDEDTQAEPENGKDIVTTLDVFVQEVTENALMKMMVGNDAEHGCAIVMETKTGKIKAIANLGRQKDGSYFEDFNYAVNPSEPGSTFKLATMMSLLEDRKITLNNIVNLEFGKWNINGSTVFDSEPHGAEDNIVSAKRAFELSSNVGMAKLAYYNYGSNPSQFIHHLHLMRMDTLTGIDLRGERNSVIYKPGSKYWSSTTLPWMAFGYNIAVTPLQTLTLYNAVANNGIMMKPYLVNAVQHDGVVVKQFHPTVTQENICSSETLDQLKDCLRGVCTEGTAKGVFKNAGYSVAGKTGTALVANGSRGYIDEIYQASFVGYFPADNPQYTCIVVIKNKPHAVKRHGADVAAPVFKEIADRLYSTRVRNASPVLYASAKTDSVYFNYVGLKQEATQISKQLQLSYNGTPTSKWVSMKVNKGVASISGEDFDKNTMPQLKGMGLKDAVYLCENIGLRVSVKGVGKVAQQSILAGQPIAKGQLLNIQLN